MYFEMYLFLKHFRSPSVVDVCDSQHKPVQTFFMVHVWGIFFHIPKKILFSPQFSELHTERIEDRIETKYQSSTDTKAGIDTIDIWMCWYW